MFTKAIVRPPGKSMRHGITTATLGPPDHDRALRQHAAYRDALRNLGLEVTVLDADEEHPDATFVEDTALLTPHCAILTHPGAPSRKGEVESMRPVLQRHYTAIETITAPGTVDAGDIMQVANHYYIGLSSRTDTAGAQQLIRLLNQYGMTGSTIELTAVLHLKTGVSYLQNNCLAVSGELVDHPQFRRYTRLEIPAAESYAANSLWVNGTVLIPAGHPITKQRISAEGYTIMELEMSEFRKLDGGLSCLSLRF